MAQSLIYHGLIMTIRLFDLYILLGKLNDCQRIDHTFHDEVKGLIKELSQTLDLLSSEPDESVHQVGVEKTHGIISQIRRAEEILAIVVTQHPAVQHLHTIRNDVAEFYHREMQFQEDLTSVYRHAYAGIVLRLLQNNHNINLQVLDHLTDIEVHHNALMFNVANMRKFAADIFFLSQFIEEKAHFKLVPLIDAVAGVYQEENLFKLAVVTPECHQYLPVMVNVPMHLTQYATTLSNWIANLSHLSHQLTQTDQVSSPLDSAKTRLQFKQRQFQHLALRADIVALLGTLRKAREVVDETKTSPLGLGLLGGVNSDDKAADKKAIDHLKSAFLLMLITQQWQADTDKLIAYQAKLKVFKPIMRAIQQAATALKQNHQLDVVVSHSSAVAETEFDEMMGSIVRFDPSDPRTLANCRIFDEADDDIDNQTSANSGADSDDEKVMRALSQAALPTLVAKALQRALENDNQLQAERAVKLRSQREKDYIRSRQNLNRFYMATINRFQQMFIGYCAIASRLTQIANRGVARVDVFTPFAKELSGFGSIIFGAIAAYSRHRYYVDGSKIASLGDIVTVMQAVEQAARKLTLAYELQIRMIHRGEERGSRIARMVAPVAKGGASSARVTKSKKKTKTASATPAFSVSHANEKQSQDFVSVLDKMKIERFDNSYLDNAAEYCVAKVMMRLLLQSDLPQGVDEISEFFVDTIMRAKASKLECETRLFDRLGFYTFTTVNGQQWHIEEIFRAPGICVRNQRDKCFDLWDQPQRGQHANPYFYRVGSTDEAQALGYKIHSQAQTADMVATTQSVKI